MSDLDLEELEDARDNLSAAVLGMLEVGTVYEGAREDISRALFRLGYVSETITRAIDSIGKPVARTAGDG